MKVSLKTNSADAISNYNFGLISNALNDESTTLALIAREMGKWINSQQVKGLSATSSQFAERSNHLMNPRNQSGNRVIEDGYTEIVYGEYEISGDYSLTVNGRLAIL